MATGTVMPQPIFTGWDDNGDPLVGGLLYTYAAGTTTPLATYSDVGLTTANANPVVLDSAGRHVVFLSPASYKFLLKTSAGVTVWTQDSISATPPFNVDVDVVGTAGETLAANQAAYLSDGSGGKTAGRWYLGDADFTYASSQALMVGMTPAAIASGESGTIRVLGRLASVSGLTAGTLYYVGAAAGSITSTAPTNARLIGMADSTTSLVLSPNPATPPGDPGRCDGRLTLTTALAVTTADVTAATTIYFTPFRGGFLSLYDTTASVWRVHTFAELSLSLSGLAANTNHDIFVYDNAGTKTLEAVAWSSDSARATGLALVNGVFVKSGSSNKRFLGTLRTTVTTGQCEDSETKRFVSNYYNRVLRPLRRMESTASWSYTSTARQANGSTSNQVAVVLCYAELLVDLALQVAVGNTTGGIGLAARIGIDAISMTNTACVGGVTFAGAAGIPHFIAARYCAIPAQGYHFFPWVEQSAATGTTTWYGASNPFGAGEQSGLIGSVMG